jgi:hypothetical protein
MLLSILTGVFGRNAAKSGDVGTNGDLIFDISGKAGNGGYLQRSTLLWAKQTLGTSRGSLVGVICPSIFATELQTLDPNNYKPATYDEQGNLLTLPNYLGLNIVEDDSVAFDTSSGICNAYLFGRGAIARQRLSVELPIEKWRAPDKSTWYLIRRWRQLLHPRGYAWIGTATNETPTNAELATASNWKQVYATKNCRFVKLACKLRGVAFEPSVSVVVDGVVKTQEVTEASDSGSGSGSGSVSG